MDNISDNTEVNRRLTILTDKSIKTEFLLTMVTLSNLHNGFHCLVGLQAYSEEKD